MNAKQLRTQKFLAGLSAFMFFVFGSFAQADTELKFEKAVFYGGPGDQTGNAVKFKEGRLYVAGGDLLSSSKGLGAGYAIPAGDLPLAAFSWRDSQKSAVSVSTAFADVAAGSDGLYFAGSSLVKLSGKKAPQELHGILAKFSLDAGKTSTPLWVVRSGFFPGRKEEVFRAVMAVDDAIYATGHASSQADNTTAVLAKYDAKGILLWSKTLGDTAAMKKSGGAALTVLNGFIYVGGFISSDGKKFSALPLKAALWKCDLSGNQIWMKSASPELYVLSGSNNTTYGVKMDVAVSDNHLYITAAKKATKASDGNVLLAKYDEEGKLIWENRWLAKSSAGDAAKYSWVSGIAAGNERLYVAGFLEYKEKKGDVDSFLIEVDKDYGSVLAVHTYGKPDQLERASGVATDGTDIYVAGTLNPLVQDKKSPSGNMDLSLLRYAALPAREVKIDIEPGTSENVIDPAAKEEQKANGKKKKAAPPKEKEIAVAIFSAKEFNAAAQVDINSLTFGRTGHEASWSGCSSKDVDRDGSLDLLCYFKPSWSPWKESRFIFERGDVQGIIKGRLLSGSRLMGKDAVNIGGVSSVPAPQQPPAPAPILTTTPPPPAAAPSAPTVESPAFAPVPTTVPSAPTPEPAVAPAPLTSAPTTALASQPVTQLVAPEPTPVVASTSPVSTPQPTPTTTTVASTTSTTATEPVLLSTATVVPAAPVTTDAPIVSAPSIQPASSTTESTASASAASTTDVIYKPLPNELAYTTSTAQATSNYQPIYISQPIIVPNQQTAASVPSPSTAPTGTTSSQALNLVRSATAHQKPGSAYALQPVFKTEKPAYQEQEFPDQTEPFRAEPEPSREDAAKSGNGLAKAYGDLGQEALRKGKFSEAATHYSDALKLDPHSPELHTGLGLVLIQQGKLEEAMSHFSEALKLNPDDKTARESLNLVLTKLGPAKTKTAGQASPTA